MKNKELMQKGGINPSMIPAIKYCKKHSHFINLCPNTQSNALDDTFRVVCPDCGCFGPWSKSLKKAIEMWNDKYGVSID